MKSFLTVALIHLLYCAIGFLFLLPLWWALASSLRPLNLALIVPGVANGIVIFLFRQFFAQVPRELVDAAKIDGASWLTIFFRIYLPLSKPVIVSAALLIFLFQWESFLWPLIATMSEGLRVIQVALAGFEQRYQIFGMNSLRRRAWQR